MTTELVDKEWPLCLPCSPPVLILGHYSLYSDNSGVDEVDKNIKNRIRSMIDTWILEYLFC